MRTLLRRVLRLIPSRSVLPVLGGPLRGARWIAGSHTHGCWLGTYEAPVQRLFVAQVNPGMVVYDVGANVGFFTLLASRLVGPSGHVYAFEPMPANLAYLRRHLQLNHVTNVTIVDCAVGRSDGRGSFASAPHRAQGHLTDSEGITVKVLSLDSASRQFAAPDFVKMDIEGGEGEAVAGATLLLSERRTVWVISSHGWQQHQQCTTLLSASGYELSEERDGTADGDYLTVARPRT